MSRPITMPKNNACGEYSSLVAVAFAVGGGTIRMGWISQSRSYPCGKSQHVSGGSACCASLFLSLPILPECLLSIFISIQGGSHCKSSMFCENELSVFVVGDSWIVLGVFVFVSVDGTFGVRVLVLVLAAVLASQGYRGSSVLSLSMLLLDPLLLLQSQSQLPPLLLLLLLLLVSSDSNRFTDAAIVDGIVFLSETDR